MKMRYVVKTLMKFPKFSIWLGCLALVILPTVVLAQDLKNFPELMPVNPNGQIQRQKQNFKVPLPEPEAVPHQPSQESLMEETIQKQLEALRSFDPSKAYYAYTTKSFQKEIPLDTFKQFVKKYAVLFRNKSFTLEGMTFSGIVATVKGKLTATDGHSSNVEYDLIQEDGAWKVRKINILKNNVRTPPKKG